MADAPSLGDFFAKKNKKKIKASNLNVQPTSKPDPKKVKAKDAEAEGWQEEEVAATSMKVEVAGKLTREEDKKEEEETAAAAWGGVKKKSEAFANLSDRKYPTLAKSVRTSTNINIDDGSQPTVNISTSKNVFAALDNEEDDDETEVKRPKEIKPAMVTKKKGERETVAIKREVDKYGPAKEEAKRAKEGKGDDDDDDEDDDDEEEVVEERKPEVKKKKKVAEKEAEAPEEPEEEKDEDCKIVADLDAAKAKYEGRKKPFPAKPLPKSELQAEKENKPQQPSGKKKKMAVFEEDLAKPKLQYADW